MIQGKLTKIKILMTSEHTIYKLQDAYTHTHTERERERVRERS